MSESVKSPRHVAVIMDGNGRWAEKNKVTRLSGHNQGMYTMKEIIKRADVLGIKYLTVYAFSTENWKRSQEEVGGIFNLLVKFVGSELAELSANNVKVHMLGDYEKVPQSAVKSIEKAVDATKDNTGLQFNIALNYGGRDEIRRAVQAISEKVQCGELAPEDIIGIPQIRGETSEFLPPKMIARKEPYVLFLDELTEFKRDTLDLLRQPMEEHRVQIARSSGTYSYPADFMLVAAMNPCPCGYYPDRNQCRCTPGEVQRYLSRISGPILDRMDICTEVPRMEFAGLTGSGKKNGSDSRQLAAQVMEARARQEERYKGMPIRFNSQLGAGDIRIFCRLGLSEQQYMERLFDTLGLSARGYHRILRLARTLADLDGEDQIGKIHLSEAACYRMAGGKYWRKSSEE